MLFVLLVVGNLLALPIWWWLFGTAVVRLWRRYRGLKMWRNGKSRLYETHQTEDRPDDCPAAAR
jgi:hypothetical protein